ncbi:RDD family protein [Mumia flava]|uniref:RDD family protein n=2 Tax=Mumia flava TaxID=1348852 RepID=A0A2M9BDT1_9ACTN|nr:RDD family protein [Mumia flava]
MPEIAGFGRRLLALLIDWIVASLTVALATGTPLAGPEAASSWWVLFAFFVEVAILDATLGYSIGKRIVGIHVIGPHGGPVGVMAFLRTALLCLVLPAILQNSEGRGFHDIAAGSVITPMRRA